MWSKQGLSYHQQASYSPRRARFIDKDFQLKYTFILVTGAALGMVIVILPVYYYMRQNYQIFYTLSYHSAPELIVDLEREVRWMTTLIVAAFLGLLLFFALLGMRLTAGIVGPIRVLRNHLKKLSRGQWSGASIRVREGDEFRELIEDYNYFFRSFQSQIQRDLDRLLKISVDSANRDSAETWRTIIEEKAAQLNVTSPISLDSPLVLAKNGKSPRAS